MKERIWNKHARIDEMRSVMKEFDVKSAKLTYSDHFYQERDEADEFLSDAKTKIFNMSMRSTRRPWISPIPAARPKKKVQIKPSE